MQPHIIGPNWPIVKRGIVFCQNLITSESIKWVKQTGRKNTNTPQISKISLSNLGVQSKCLEVMNGFLSQCFAFFVLYDLYKYLTSSLFFLAFLRSYKENSKYLAVSLHVSHWLFLHLNWQNVKMYIAKKKLKKGQALRRRGNEDLGIS